MKNGENEVKIELGMVRARAIEFNKLVYGWLMDGLPVPATKITYVQNEELRKIKVYPDSINLYTGIKDRTGQPIFEHDLVNLNSKHGEIIYRNGCFWWECKEKEPLPMYSFILHDPAVVGYYYHGMIQDNE